MAINWIINSLFQRKTYSGNDATTIPESVISFAPSITSDPNWEDPWFSAHFEGVAERICADNFLENLSSDRTILDFGCGDGMNSAGVASRICAQVTGVDLTRAFDTLTDTLSRKGIPYPDNLKFSQSKPGKKLPFDSESFDAVYSWSVFEHVADVQAVLREIFRVLKPGGTLYIQIEPLFHGPYGSHLRRLVDQPWAHLSMTENDFLSAARTAEDNVPSEEQDVLYRKNEFQQVKNYLLNEYKTLNRITAPELLRAVSSSGFSIESSTIIKVGNLTPPRSIVEKHGEDMLTTNEILLRATKKQ